MLLGKDTDGITEVSLQKLRDIHSRDHQLAEVRIRSDDRYGIMCEFVFVGGDTYEASGFSIGYGGEGPHGLWKAIQMFHPILIEADFWKTGISTLDPQRSWRWSVYERFQPL